jgi:hypothetical protein
MFSASVRQTSWRLLFTAVCLALACHAAKDGAGERYLYVVGCAATVDKLDLRIPKKIGSYDLSVLAANALPQVNASNATFDGCLTNGALYYAADGRFYTVAPVRAQLNEQGKDDYQLLAFSVPDLKFVSKAAAGNDLPEAPRLRRDSGQPRCIRAAEADEKFELDLSSYSPDKKRISNLILERSGSKTLLQITENEPDSCCAIADGSTMQVVRLKPSFPAVSQNFHLAPGGQVALAEEVVGQKKTGSLELLGAATGLPVTRMKSSSSIEELTFLTITPSGLAIYHAAGEYVFVKLGRSFPAEDISASHNEIAPRPPLLPFFYASR